MLSRRIYSIVTYGSDISLYSGSLNHVSPTHKLNLMTILMGILAQIHIKHILKDKVLALKNTDKNILIIVCTFNNI